MKNKDNKGLKVIIVVMAIAICVLGYDIIMTRKADKNYEEQVRKKTENYTSTGNNTAYTSTEDKEAYTLYEEETTTKKIKPNKKEDFLKSNELIDIKKCSGEERLEIFQYCDINSFNSYLCLATSMRGQDYSPSEMLNRITLEHEPRLELNNYTFYRYGNGNYNHREVFMAALIYFLANKYPDIEQFNATVKKIDKTSYTGGYNKVEHITITFEQNINDVFVMLLYSEELEQLNYFIYDTATRYIYRNPYCTTIFCNGISQDGHIDDNYYERFDSAFECVIRTGDDENYVLPAGKFKRENLEYSLPVKYYCNYDVTIGYIFYDNMEDIYNVMIEEGIKSYYKLDKIPDTIDVEVNVYGTSYISIVITDDKNKINCVAELPIMPFYYESSVMTLTFK